MFGNKQKDEKIKSLEVKIAALQEGQRDILSSDFLNRLRSVNVVDKNNFPTYQIQIDKAYEMYDSESDYGSELFGGIVDTLVAFLGGEGISYFTEKKATEKYIEKFFDLNNWQGSRLIEMLEICCLEGKDLVILSPEKTTKLYKGKKIDGYIKARNFQYKTYPYEIELDPKDKDKITKIKYSDKTDMAGQEVASPDKSVFIKVGGSPGKVNNTTYKTHKILTDIENVSRTKYDLRKNHHLFAKIMPIWETQTQDEADAINNDVNTLKFEIGRGYAGTAKFNLVGPPLGAVDAITKEIILYMKNISTSTFIPIHWMAWPELMSNRATAENLLEVVNAGTKKERLILEEKFKEMIEKSMLMAIDAGLEDNNIIGEFHIKLPLISMATLKLINELWIPLMQSDIVSIDTVRNLVPGITPATEKRLIEKAKQENMEMFQEGLMTPGSPNNPQNNMKGEQEDDQDDDSGENGTE